MLIPVHLFFAASAMTQSPQQPPGFFAEPPSKKAPAVLVLHPWWGLNQDVKDFCGRLANQGFVALAPDLFEGKIAKTPEEAEALVRAYESSHLQLKSQIAKAARWLAGRGSKELSVIGFSFGAYYALHLSNEEHELVRKVAVFYGTGHEDFGKSRASYLCHFAEKDDFEPKSSVDSLAKLLKDAGRPAETHTYPGTGHWFFEPSVASAYDQGAADLAWKRTLEFLKRT